MPDEEKEGRVIVTEHVYEFIKKLIIHIPNREFKTIRYYGLYSSKGRKRRKNEAMPNVMMVDIKMVAPSVL